MQPVIITTDGELSIDAHFMPADIATQTLQHLRATLRWQEESIQRFGKVMRSPRLVCWYGDPDARYCYSGIEHEPLAWTPALIELREKIRLHSGHRFNSVLGNLYRDGNDSMGWHADQEPELGGRPVIAALSLGESRIFSLRHNKTGQTHRIELQNGSLLIMAGELQQHWRHCIPKTKRTIGARINLSFRQILIPSA